jgi:O-antigen/teichoic acid export membrane protein
VTTVLLALALTAAWVGAYRVVVAHPLDAAALMLYLLGLDMVLRPWVLALRLDTPFPDGLLGSGADVVARVTPALLLWTLFFVVGHLSLRPVSAGLRLALPRFDGQPSQRRLAAVGWVVWGAAALGTAALLASSGSVQAFMRTAKLDKGFAGVVWLRSFSFVAVTVFVALFLLALRQGGASRRRQAFTLVGFATAAGMSFLWGARDAAVFGSAALLVGAAVLVPRGGADANGGNRAFARGRLTAKGWRRLALYGLVGLTLVVGLRVYRDVLLYDEVQSTIADAPLVRQLSVAANNTTLDSLALGLDTWPSRREFNDGADFVRSVAGSLPVLRSEPYELPAVQLARTYVPRRLNGWPMSPIGEWYVNFGYAGIAVGAALSGALARALQVAFRSFATNPLAWAISVMLVCRVFPAGIWTNSVTRYLLLGVPLYAVVRLSRDRTVDPLVVVKVRPSDVLARMRDPMLVTSPPQPLMSQPVMPPFPAPTTRRSGRRHGQDPIGSGLPLPDDPSTHRGSRAQSWYDGFDAADDQSSGHSWQAPEAPSRRRSARDGVLVLAGQVLSIVSGIAVTFVAARTLSKDDVGVLAWALGLSTLLSVVASWGAGAAAVALVNEGSSGERDERARALLRQAGLISAVVCGAWLVAVGPLLAWASRDAGYAGTVLLVAAMVPTAAVLLVVDGCLRGVHDFEGSVWAGDHVRRILIVLVLLAIGAGAVETGFGTALLVVPLGEAALLVVLVRRLRRRIRGLRAMGHPTERPAVVTGRQTFAFSTHFVPGTLSGLVIPQAGVWLAALVTSASEVADLSIAVRFSFLLNLAFFVGQRVFGPRLAAARGALTSLLQDIRAYAAFATGAAIVVAVGFVVAGRPLLRVAFGPEYESAWWPLVVLSAGQLVTVAAGMGAMSLNYSGHPRVVGRLSLLAIAVFVPAALVGGWLGGAAGVAVPAAVVIGGQGILQTRAVSRLLGVDIRPSAAALRAHVGRRP